MAQMRHFLENGCVKPILSEEGELNLRGARHPLLAQALVRNVTQATSRPDRGAQWGYYYVTRSTVCPAVLLEAGFMVNPSEYENVTSEPQLWAAGDAIARSVLECVPPG